METVSFFHVMAMQYGIAMQNVSVRTEPDMEPLRGYEGDVWDRRQESRLTIGEPVLLKRLENGWTYVFSDATEGYANEKGFLFCTRRYYERYKKLRNRKFQVVIKAGRYKGGAFFRVGSRLPLLDGKETGRVLGTSGRMEEIQCLNDAPVLIQGYLPFTERQLRLQMERMLNIPYSWGDERGDGMDCSSTVHGFYACFGIELPRNSEEQRSYGEALYAMNRAEYEDLRELSREERKNKIRAMGPGAVLHMPGHVMLYAGEREGEPLIFHNCDTYTEKEEEHIVRKCVYSGFLPKGEGTYLDYLTAVWKYKR